MRAFFIVTGLTELYLAVLFFNNGVKIVRSFFHTKFSKISNWSKNMERLVQSGVPPSLTQSHTMFTRKPGWVLFNNYLVTK